MNTTLQNRHCFLENIPNDENNLRQVRRFVQLLEKLGSHLVFRPDSSNAILEIEDKSPTECAWVKIEGAHQGLLLWAILTDKEDMMNYFWRKSRMSIPAALAIASICRTVTEDRGIAEDTRTDYHGYR